VGGGLPAAGQTPPGIAPPHSGKSREPRRYATPFDAEQNAYPADTAVPGRCHWRAGQGAVGAGHGASRDHQSRRSRGHLFDPGRLQVTPRTVILPFHSALILFAGPIFCLFLLSILNLALRRWRPSSAFRPSKFAVIYGLTTVAASIAAQDEAQYLLPTFVFPFRATRLRRARLLGVRRVVIRLV
jgi:hypothetical protein